MSKKKWFPEILSTPGEDAVETAEMKPKNLEYYIKLVDKIAAGFERIHFNFESSSTVNEMLLKVLHATEKSFVKGKVH